MKKIWKCLSLRFEVESFIVELIVGKKEDDLAYISILPSPFDKHYCVP